MDVAIIVFATMTVESIATSLYFIKKDGWWLFPLALSLLIMLTLITPMEASGIYAWEVVFFLFALLGDWLFKK